VTPSLVMRGAPNDLSSTTLRPLGPSVTFTALLRISTPAQHPVAGVDLQILLSLAAIVCVSECLCSGGLVEGRSRGLLLGDALFDDRPMMSLSLHDEEILAIDLDLGAGPLAEQHAVARLRDRWG